MPRTRKSGNRRVSLSKRGAPKKVKMARPTKRNTAIYYYMKKQEFFAEGDYLVDENGNPIVDENGNKIRV